MDTLNLNLLTDVMAGSVISAGDPTYDSARKIWNGFFDKRPKVIALCNNTQDVVTAVNFARINNFALSVKGGGHNSAGTAACDNGVMIDLSPMKKVEVNEKNKTVKVQGGSLWSDVDKETMKYGLAVPCGIISHTGVGGLTLGGGFGWISRKHGLTIDNLISAEVVTAEGKIVRTSENENPDLFWAIRGGGGNFGVVTEFEFKCSEVRSEIYSGVLIKKIEDINKFFSFYRDYVRKMPDDMTIWVVIRTAPPLPFIPEEMHGKLVIVVPFAYLGEHDKGNELIQPLRDITETIGDGSGPHPYLGWQSAFDGLVPHGARNYWKSHHLTSLTDECVDVLNEFAKKMPTSSCEIFIPHMEGAPSRVPVDATAFAHRNTPFVLNIHTRWENPADDEKCLRWAKEFHDATKPFSQGVYVNFLSNEGEERVKQAYTPDVWTRLVEAKRKWDKNNLFRLNQNIRPE